MEVGVRGLLPEEEKVGVRGLLPEEDTLPSAQYPAQEEVFERIKESKVTQALSWKPKTADGALSVYFTLLCVAAVTPVPLHSLVRLVWEERRRRGFPKSKTMLKRHINYLVSSGLVRIRYFGGKPYALVPQDVIRKLSELFSV